MQDCYPMTVILQINAINFPNLTGTGNVSGFASFSTAGGAI